MTKGQFGSCCDVLKEMLSDVPNPLIQPNDRGVLMMAVGAVETKDGIGWFDHAVLFCPFCGSRLQTSEDIQSKVDS